MYLFIFWRGVGGVVREAAGNAPGEAAGKVSGEDG